MNIAIELCGYKAKLTSIYARAANPPWQTEDDLAVYVEFDEPYPESIISTAVSIPLKIYTREELVETVKKEGEKQVAATLAKHREEREKNKRQAEHKQALEAFAKELEAKIEAEAGHGQ